MSYFTEEFAWEKSNSRIAKYLDPHKALSINRLANPWKGGSMINTYCGSTAFQFYQMWVFSKINQMIIKQHFKAMIDDMCSGLVTDN